MTKCCDPCCDPCPRPICWVPTYPRAPPIDWDKISDPQPQQQPCPPEIPTPEHASSAPKRPPEECVAPPPKKPKIEEEEEEHEIVFNPVAPDDPPDDPFEPPRAEDIAADPWFEQQPGAEDIGAAAGGGNGGEATVIVEDDIPSTDTEDELDFTNNPAPTPPPTPPPAMEDWTPDINAFTAPQFGGVAGIQSATTRSQNVPTVTDQTPYGIDWLNPSWPAATWDGVTTIDPGTMTTAQCCAFLWPAGPDAMLGTQQFWDQWVSEGGGFADPTNPTSGEIQEWTKRMILGFRHLTQNPTPLTINKCLMMRALWSDERKYTTKWDAAYPGTCGTAYGPCQPCGSGGNAHCGESFVPNTADQEPYHLATSDGMVGDSCSSGGGASGIFTTNTDIPWSVKISRVMKTWFCSKDAGHFGPFLGREELGYHWLDFGGNGTTWRGKWSGPLNAHPYNTPTDW